MGFLPGDVEDKLEPYMQPLRDNLKIIQSQFPEDDRQYQHIDSMIKEEKLVIEPLSYIRGRSLERIFFIVDEAQNLTPHEVKTIITRAGEGAKLVLTGDIFQIDHPYLDAQSNGLSYLIEHFKGQRLYGHVNLSRKARGRNWPNWRAICCRSRSPDGNLRFSKRACFSLTLGKTIY
jgi:PhoH-like ATPase